MKINNQNIKKRDMRDTISSIDHKLVGIKICYRSFRITKRTAQGVKYIWKKTHIIMAFLGYFMINYCMSAGAKSPLL